MPDRHACFLLLNGSVLRIDLATGFGLLEPGTLRFLQFLRIDPYMARGKTVHSYSHLWDEVTDDLGGVKVVEDNGRPTCWSDARLLLDLRQMYHACVQDTQKLAKLVGVTGIHPAVLAKSESFEASSRLLGLRSDIDRAVKREPQFQLSAKLQGMKGLKAFGSILLATKLVQPRKAEDNTIPARLKDLGLTKKQLYPKKKLKPEPEPPQQAPEPVAIAFGVAVEPLGDDDDGDTPPASEIDYGSADSALDQILEQGVDLLENVRLPGSEDDMLEEEKENPASMSVAVQELRQHLRAKEAEIDEKDALLEEQAAELMHSNHLIRQLRAELLAAPRSPAHQQLLAHQREAAATSLPRRAKRARKQ